MDNNIEKINSFIGEHHVLTLATAVDNQPYISNCFYIYNADRNSFIFTSNPETRHGSEMITNTNVAAGIVLETKAVGKIQGLQITGTVVALEGNESKKAKISYLKSYPYAILNMETMWELKADFFKLTDNRLGFGKKLKWERALREPQGKN